MCLSIAKKHYFPKLPKHKEPPGELVNSNDFYWYGYQSMAHGSDLFKVIFPFLRKFFFF